MHVVARIGHEPRGLLEEDPRDVLRGQVRALRRRHAEVAGDVLEPVGRQVSRGHVVELGEDPRVDDVAPGHGVAAVGDAPIGDLHAATA